MVLMSVENNFEGIEKVRNKFNWGAFGGSVMWLAINKNFIGFFLYFMFSLLFVPTITLLVVPIVLIVTHSQMSDSALIIGAYVIRKMVSLYVGFKGNSWALEKKKFKSLEDFESFQNKYLVCIIIVWEIVLLAFLLAAIHELYDMRTLCGKSIATLVLFLAMLLPTWVARIRKRTKFLLSIIIFMACAGIAMCDMLGSVIWFVSKILPCIPGIMLC